MSANERPCCQEARARRAARARARVLRYGAAITALLATPTVLAVVVA